MGSVHIRLRSNKVNRHGEAPLVIRIVHEGKMTEVSLKRYIKPSLWDDNREQVKAGHPSRSAWNVFLNREKTAYQQALDELLLVGAPFQVKEVVAKKNGTHHAGANQRITDYLAHFIEENPERLSSGTLNNYQSLKARLESYKPAVTFADITPQWLQRFERHLDRQGLAAGTIHNRMKVLRKLMKLAHRNEWIERDPFLHHRLRTSTTQREYLTRDELEQFKAYIPPQTSYKLVREVFVFSCYTGLRFGDICQLKHSNVTKETNEAGEEVYKLSFRIAKTGEVISLKLPHPAVQIIQAHGYPGESESRLFPLLPDRAFRNEADLKRQISSKNAYANKILKELMQKAGISKSISMHCARHTFAVMALQLGIPMEVLSKLLGHKDLKTIQIYGKIVSRTMDDAMDRFNSL